LLWIAAGNSAGAQPSKEFVGSWTLLSAITEKDGVKSDIFGPHAKGMLVFDDGGHYAIIFVAGDLPKFAANSRAMGTAEENKAVVGGSLAHFGTYVVNEGDRTFTFRMERCTYPNWEGAELKRSFVLAKDQLTYTDPNASAGGFATVIWARVK
jgi:hypothetical protein